MAAKITDKERADWLMRKDTSIQHITAGDLHMGNVPYGAMYQAWSQKIIEDENVKGAWVYGHGKIATIDKAIRAERKGKK